ncbi:MAG: hypothetical protein WC054_02270 [Candidatus Nanopelagicales bacterium]
MNAPTVEDLLAGGTPALKFDGVGETHSGTVLGASAKQVTDFTTGEPKFFKNGDPQMQIILELQTDQRNGVDDDGMRRLYVKGAMLSEARKAIARAGARTFEAGARVRVTYTGDGEASARGMNPPKLYAFEYVPPAAAQVANAVAPAVAPTVAAAPPAAAQVAAPAQQVPAQQAGTALTEAQITQLRGLGFSEEKIAAMSN